MANYGLMMRNGLARTLWPQSIRSVSTRSTVNENKGTLLSRRDQLISSTPELIFDVSNDEYLGKATVCWHPEIPYSYEATQPLPTEVNPTESTMKVQALYPVRETFRKKHERMIVRELQLLTYSDKRRWFGKLGTAKRAKLEQLNPMDQKRDREFL